MPDENNEVHKFLQFLRNDPLGRIASLIIGGIIAVLIYEKFVMSQKEAQLVSMGALIEVKEERMKLIYDQVRGLKTELVYKPLKEQRLFEELTLQYNALKIEKNALKIEKNALLKLGVSIKASKDVIVEINKLENNIRTLKESNNDFISKLDKKTKSLQKYESLILVDSKHLAEGSSWQGFGGQVNFGLLKISVYGSAKINLSVKGKTSASDVFPGDQLDFSIGENKYLINISQISYVGSKISISISKEIPK